MRLSWLVVAAAIIACDPARPFAPASDRVIWRAAPRGWGRAAYDNTSAYFVGWDHEVVGVDKAIGLVRWRSRTDDSGPTTLGHYVVMVDSLVIAGDLDVYAFDRSTGRRVWKFRPADGNAAGIYQLVSNGELVFAGSSANYLYAVDARTGMQRWATAFSDSVYSFVHPTYRDGTVFVCIRYETRPSTGGLAAVDASTGSIRWLTLFPAEPPLREAGCWTDVVVIGDLVAGSSLDGHVYALDRATGTIVWSAGGAGSMDLLTLATDGTALFVGSGNGFVTVYDGATGIQRWKATANRASVRRIVADSSQMYVLHDGGQLAAMDLRSGRINWMAGDSPSGGEFFDAPAIDVGRIYIGGDHGLYALRK